MGVRQSDFWNCLGVTFHLRISFIYKSTLHQSKRIIDLTFYSDPGVFYFINFRESVNRTINLQIVHYGSGDHAFVLTCTVLFVRPVITVRHVITPPAGRDTFVLPMTQKLTVRTRSRAYKYKRCQSGSLAKSFLLGVE